MSNKTSKKTKVETCIEQINKINKLKKNDYKCYLDTENLDILHKIKLYADDLYYNTGDNTGLTDEQYDMMVDILTKRDPGYVVPIGTRIRESDNRVKVDYHMGSMNKFRPHIPEEVKGISRWIKKHKATKYIIEPKLDGVSCLIVIKNRKYKLYKRPGDDGYGSNISYLLQYFSSIPKGLPDMAVRGELIMRKDIFEQKYSKNNNNARNMVSGRTGGKTIREGLDDIDFVAYEIIYDDGVESCCPSNQLELLEEFGFITIDAYTTPNISTDSLQNTLTTIKNDCSYVIDGIIVQPDMPYERNLSGNPEYAFAFKIQDEESMVNATVEEVEWNVSKWGKIKPTIRITPVKIGEITITYATAFNAQFIVDNNIGKGSIINIIRSGDVIPYIVLPVIKPSKHPSMPDYPYQWNGVDIYTVEESNKSDEQTVKSIVSFFSALSIKHIAQATVEKLVNAGFNSELDIIAATQDQFEELDGFGKKLAERTYTNIHEGLKNITIPEVIGAAGMFGEGFGKKRVEKLMSDIPDLFTVYKTISTEELKNRIMKVEGFSSNLAGNITDNISEAAKYIKKLGKYATYKQLLITDNYLKGKTFVFTGFRDKQLEEQVVTKGGKVSASVSKNTTAIVVSSKDGEISGKREKAANLGIAEYTKEEFIERFLHC